MKNIRFVIDGIDMQMGNDSMSLQLNNPMFKEVGSHSLPLKVPSNPHNDIALEGFHPGATTSLSRFPAKLLLGAVPYYGEFIASKRNDQYYEGYFTTGNSTFRDAVRGKKLTDIDYMESIIGPINGRFPEELNNAVVSSYPTFNYTCFPIRTPDFFKPYEFTYNTLMNPWSFEHGVPASQGFVKDFPQRYAPSFYLCFVISEIFAQHGYALEENDLLDDSELNTLVVTNFNSGYMGIVSQQYDLKFSEALPAIEINDYISGLENLLNITFFINEQSNTVVIKKKGAIVKSLPSKKLKLVRRELNPSESLDGFSLEYTMDQNDSFALVKSIDGLEVGVNVANVEDLSGYFAGNFPFKLARISNHDLYYISKMHAQVLAGWFWEVYNDSIEGLEILISVPNLEDLSDYPAGSFSSQLAWITNDDIYYISKMRAPVSASWEWEFYSRDFHGYSEGAGELEIKTDINPILTDADVIDDIYSEDPYQELAIIPRVNNSCINSFGWQEFKSFDSLRLLFYRGIVSSGGNVDTPALVECNYPLATPDVYRAYSTVAGTFGRVKISTANQSLRWGGTYGLYNTHWKDYLHWFLNIKREATDYYDISHEELMGINFWEKYQSGDQSVLFRSIDLDINFARDEIRVGECKVYLS